MALTNAEKQARWRERHAMKRYAVQRISKAILRLQWSDDTIPELASALRSVLNTAGIGSGNHVAGELFKMMTGVNLVHVRAACQVGRHRTSRLACRLRQAHRRRDRKVG